MPFSALSLSCFRIVMRFGDTELSTGTAFLWKHGEQRYLVTNRHNVTGRNNDTAVCLSKLGGIPDRISVRIPNLVEGTGARPGAICVHIAGPPTSFEIMLLKDGKPLWLEHKTFAGKIDIACLPVLPTDFPNLRCVNEIDSGIDIPISPSDRVSILGFPFGQSVEEIYAVWVNGFIASEPELNFEGLPVFLVDSRTRKGSSGSPVFSYAPYGSVQTGVGESASYQVPIQKFWGIYSGRLNEDSDIGKVWKRCLLDSFFD